MYEDHPSFQPPTDPGVSIWRYMNLAKFVSMLSAQALHFARVSEMEDVFEGSIGKATLEQLRKTSYAAITDSHFDFHMAHSSEVNKRILRDYTYLNCWHMSEHESVAMWKLYQSGEPQGIAIRSTYRRLVDSITDSRPVRIGTVSYIDFDTEPQGDDIHPIVHKRKAYEFEREIRAVHSAPWAVVDPNDSNKWVWPPAGPTAIPFATDLDMLVERVYVSPNARDWFADVVRDVLVRYGKGWRVEHSSIDGEPTF